MSELKSKCNCAHCRNHHKYKWAKIMECGCGCHEKGFVSHDGLCCEIPNVLKSNNPYTDLKPSSYYLKKMNS